MTWILIVMLYKGGVTNVGAFKTKVDCEAAGVSVSATNYWGIPPPKTVCIAVPK